MKVVATVIFPITVTLIEKRPHNLSYKPIYGVLCPLSYL